MKPTKINWRSYVSHNFSRSGIWIISCLMLTFITIPQSFYCQTTQYSFQLGNSGAEQFFNIAVDSLGNNYHTFFLVGSIDVDPGPGVTTIVGDAAGAGFLLKLDSNGGFVWVKKIPCTYVTDIEFDPQGNLLMVGRFGGSRDFDIGPGVFNLTANYSAAAFVLKLDPNGNFIWANKIDGSGGINATSVTALPDGSVVFSGTFDDTLYHYSTGLPQYVDDEHFGDGYMCKLSSVGVIQWVKHYQCLDFGGGADMVTDGNGFIYAAIDLYGGRAINPGPPSSYWTMVGIGGDEGLTKLDGNGGMVDYVAFSSQGGVFRQPDALCVLPNNNITIGLAFHDTLYSPAWLPLMAQGQRGSGVLIEMDPQLDLVWYGQFEGTGAANVQSIDIDPAGNRIVTGMITGGYVDLDFGPGSTIITGPFSTNHGFVAKYSPNWQLIYGKKFDQTGGMGSVVGTDKLGGIYVSGNFDYTLDGDIFAPVNTLSSGGNNDDLCFIKIEGSCTASVTSSVSLTHCGAYNWNGQVLSTSGIYRDTLYTSLGCDSMLTLNLTVNQPTVGSQSASACNSYIWPINGQTYTTSGTYNAILTNSAGCDSTVTLNLTIHQPNSSSQTVSACSSYTWLTTGQTYTTSGNYNTVLTNSMGCDSIVTLNLMVNQPSASSQTVSACSSYTWPTTGQTFTTSGIYNTVLTNSMGCDSTVTLNLTVNQPSASNQTVSACESYTWPTNSQTYTTTGTYTAILTNSAGCDSTLTLNLTINQVDTNVATVGPSLIAVSAGTYQWVDCNAGFAPIPGANAATYTPTVSGSFAVAITLNGCTDTSGCHTMVVTGVEGSIIEMGQMSIFPNPADQVLSLNWNAALTTAGSIEIWNAMGQTLLEQTVEIQAGENKMELSISKLAEGNYWLVYRTEKGIQVRIFAIQR